MADLAGRRSGAFLGLALRALRTEAVGRVQQLSGTAAFGVGGCALGVSLGEAGQELGAGERGGALYGPQQERVLLSGGQGTDPCREFSVPVGDLGEGKAGFGGRGEQVGIEFEEVGQSSLRAGQLGQTAWDGWFVLGLELLLVVLAQLPGGEADQPCEVEGTQVTEGDFAADAEAADARELVEQLGTGDATAGVRSSGDLPRLGLVLEWAKTARLVRVAKGRLYAVAKAEPLLRDPLALWRRAFEAFFELRGPLIGPRSGWHVESMLFDAYDDVLPDVLATLYSLPHPMPWPRLRDSVHLAYRAGFQLGGFGGHSLWFEDADRDLRTVLAALEDLGAIARDQGMADPVFLDVPLDEGSSEPPAGMPPELAQLLGAAAADEGAAERAQELKAELTAGPVELIRLTALGTESVRRRLLAEGRDAPLVGELAQAPAAGLLGVLAEHYDPDSARAELATWIAAHSDPQAAGDAHGTRGPHAARSPHAAVERLTDAVRAMPFRTRAEAMLDVLVEAPLDPRGSGSARLVVARETRAVRLGPAM